MIRHGWNWMLYKAPHVLGALLGLYAIFFTHRSLAETSHERRVKELERLTLVGLLDAESGQRGYVLTGNNVFLDQYHAGLKALSIYRPLYRRALLDRRSQALFTELDSLLNRKEQEMALTITVRKEKGRDAAAEIVNNRIGHGYTAAIQDLSMEIRESEERRASMLDFWRTTDEVNLHDPDSIPHRCCTSNGH